MKFFSRNGRTEKVIQNAHHGAIICHKFTYDGTALLTCGEDGEAKLWSRTGNFRSTIVSLEDPIFACVWSPDDNSLAVTNNNKILIKTIQSSASSVSAMNSNNIPNNILGMNKKTIEWEAHKGLILALDWNLTNNLIISGGEDCTYKVWDHYGRALYSSSPYSKVITSLAWAPNGDIFAVGSFNMLRICDKIGWTYCRGGENKVVTTIKDSEQSPPLVTNSSQLRAGSIYSISWTADGTQLAAGCGDGSVMFAQLINRKIEYKDMEIILISSRKIRVIDHSQSLSVPSSYNFYEKNKKDSLEEGSYEDIELNRDRIIEFAVGFDHLILTTSTQCYIYSLNNLNTPYIMELRHPVRSIKLGLRHFCLLDSIQGLQVVSYEGKVLNMPKYNGMRGDFLTKELFSISPDTLVVVDTVERKSVYVFDINNGKLIGRIYHPFCLNSNSNMISSNLGSNYELVSVCLNQVSHGLQERVLVFQDKNLDLFVTLPYSTPVTGGTLHTSTASVPQIQGALNVSIQKIASHVQAFSFSDSTNLLAIIYEDGKGAYLPHPESIFLGDKELLKRMSISFEAQSNTSSDSSNTRSASKNILSRGISISQFIEPRLILRHSDGSLTHRRSPSSLLSLLSTYVRNSQWEQAIKLCQVTSNNNNFESSSDSGSNNSNKLGLAESLWATLASLSLSKKNLSVAIQCYNELEDVPKVEQLNYIKSLQCEEVRQAELLLIMKKPIFESEKILLQASPPLIYRVIKINLHFFQFSRALSNAKKYIEKNNKKHFLINYILAYRDKYLKEFNREEKDENFLKIRDKYNYTWDEVFEFEREEEEEENRRGNDRNMRK